MVRSSLDDLIMDIVKVYPGNKEMRLCEENPKKRQMPDRKTENAGHDDES
jgi:hypothetical protein